MNYYKSVQKILWPDCKYYLNYWPKFVSKELPIHKTTKFHDFCFMQATDFKSDNLLYTAIRSLYGSCRHQNKDEVLGSLDQTEKPNFNFPYMISQNIQKWGIGLILIKMRPAKECRSYVFLVPVFWLWNSTKRTNSRTPEHFPVMI